MLYIAICNPDMKFLKRIEQDIRDIISKSDYCDNELNIFTTNKPVTLERYTEKQNVDILFTETVFENTSGIELAVRLSPQVKKLIFISSHSQTVFESLKAKPFRFVRMENYNTEFKKALIEALDEIHSCNEIITIKKWNEKTGVNVKDIKYILKSGNYCIMYMHNGEEIRYRITVGEVARVLCKNGFMRINSGIIVNSSFLKCISGNCAEMIDEKIFPISRRRLPELKEKFGSYFFAGNI